MARKDIADLAQRFHTGYLLPRLRRRVGGVAKVRIAVVTVVEVDPGGVVGIAVVLTAEGDRMVLPYGSITPVADMHWRAISWDGGPPILDDAVPILDAA